CDELYDSGIRTTGLYTIAPNKDNRTFRVVCDMNDQKRNGGWTVLQHRQEGNVNFSRNWHDYVTGFGDLQGDFWLGLEYMHLLTSKGVQLIIDMVSDVGELYRYTYDDFSVLNASTSYQLSVGNDTSVNCTSGGYGLQLNNGHPFATYDKPDVNNCSTGFTTHEPVSGWWFWSCATFNINGQIGYPDYEWGMALDCWGIRIFFLNCKGCDELYDSGIRTTGLYTIAPAKDNRTFRVVCDMNDQKRNGGWTVLQHRQEGNVNFSRNWHDYVTGFGDLQGDFWLGLEYIHLLTSKGVQLIIDMVSDVGELYRYTYDDFSVLNASTSYQLSVGNDTSVNCTRGGYGLQLNNGHPFATYDKPDVNNCSTGFTTHEPVSGWWFWSCTFFNINGQIGHPNYEWGMALDCRGITVMLNQTTMKIK
ncbi:uncharacterized protein, partial [Argopecten irradians]|uniref:uncharacterized protein n=1 Tax=Argopecten irradians TaxID=31199 RepID=UPI003715952A